jgi:hypothetical protein
MYDFPQSIFTLTCASSANFCKDVLYRISPKKKENRGFSSWSHFIDGKMRWEDGLGVFVKLYKGKADLVQGWTGPECSRRLRFPEVPENRNMKVVRLSVLRIGHVFAPQNIADTHFC